MPGSLEFPSASPITPTKPPRHLNSLKNSELEMTNPSTPLVTPTRITQEISTESGNVTSTSNNFDNQQSPFSRRSLSIRRRRNSRTSTPDLSRNTQFEANDLNRKFVEMQDYLNGKIQKLTPTKPKRKVSEADSAVVKFLNSERQLKFTMQELTKLKESITDSNVLVVMDRLQDLITVQEKLQLFLNNKDKIMKVVDIYAAYAHDFEFYVKYNRAFEALKKSNDSRNSISEIEFIKLEQVNQRIMFYQDSFARFRKIIREENNRNRIGLLMDQLKAFQLRTEHLLIVDIILNSPLRLDPYVPIISQDSFKVSGAGLDDAVEYQLLLFSSSLLVITKPTEEEKLNFVDLVRLDQASLTYIKQEEIVKISVNYGPRRGSDMISINTIENNSLAKFFSLLEQSQNFAPKD